MPAMNPENPWAQALRNFAQFGERDLVDADRRNFLGKLHHSVVRYVPLDGATE